MPDDWIDGDYDPDEWGRLYPDPSVGRLELTITHDHCPLGRESQVTKTEGIDDQGWLTETYTCTCNASTVHSYPPTYQPWSHERGELPGPPT